MGPRGRSHIPQRGDIFLVDLNPTEGHEQQGKRYVLVVSPTEFNAHFGTAIVCPITQGGNLARNEGFAVSLTGSGGVAQGVALCNQLRTIDLPARKAKFIEKAAPAVLSEVLDRIVPLFER